MAADAKLVMQTLVTKTGTFNSTAIDLKVGTPVDDVLWCRVIYLNANTSSGAGAATFRVTESDDNSSFSGIYQPTETTGIVLGTTAISGEVYIPIVTKKRYVRLELSAISGTGATVDYQADLVSARP